MTFVSRFLDCPPGNVLLQQPHIFFVTRPLVFLCVAPNNLQLLTK